MIKNAIVSDKLADKFRTEKETTYTRFIANEGLDIVDGLYVRNLNHVALKPWARRGGNAVFINHDASRTTNDCYVMEIPAGGKLVPQRQLFEETILILSGRGSTTVWNDRGDKA
ncbi:MAG: ethanolamine ammonia lyase-activating protein, partial [Candidatus Puniceispirillaceae bacterium]